MQQLEEQEIRKITRAISTMGEVQSDFVEEIMDEFGLKLSDNGGIFGSIQAARTLLASFLPSERVEDILMEIQDTKTGDLWGELSKIEEKSLLRFLEKERDQTAAAILSRLEPDITAKLLHSLDRRRSVQIVNRMLTMGDLPRESVRILEDSLRHEVMSQFGNDAAATRDNRIVSVFNKIDRDLFEEIERTLEKSAPDRLRSIKQKMFVFDDLIQLDATQLAKVFREVSGTTVPYALRGASKEIRDHFLNSLPSRSRDMLQEEMNELGPLKSRHVKKAQADLIEATLKLAQDGEISLETSETEEEMI